MSITFKTAIYLRDLDLYTTKYLNYISCNKIADCSDVVRFNLFASVILNVYNIPY